ncbi:zinc finger MYM-type protein 1-like [Hydra vulgaris]|uniref:zinc finger MYM-type protein 1-like n=1 Tax=Hydra vulgaris TaxID=6087 RepID=UPI0032EA67DF
MSSDPGEWKFVMDNMRQFLVKKVPVQIHNFAFPVNNKGRQFSPSLYNRKLPNGAHAVRSWLIYLQSQDSNELIQLIPKNIKEYIVQQIKISKYYSIIVDCTPDQSHVEQMSIIIRFVFQDKNRFEIHFLGFIPVADTSGKGLTENILKELEDNQIYFEDMRGQGYDNSSNIKRKRLGVQSRILQLNPRSVFVPCACHSLNLFVNDAASASDENRDNQTKLEAQSLSKKVSCFKFICSLIMWYDILSKVNIVSKIMQSPNLNLLNCNNALKEVLVFLNNYRQDETFVKVVDEAKKIAEILMIDNKFPDVSTIQIRKKKGHFNYESNDLPIIDSQQNYKVNFFFNNWTPQIIQSMKDLNS